MEKIVAANAQGIGKEVLADEVHLGRADLKKAKDERQEDLKGPVFTKDWDINGETVTLGVARA